ncbi:RNA polymerase sigma factor [Gimesia aquarii]|uniref:ECF RNA polymerase sigma factor SigW n=1 Tax=Gimesia aquarii TaxID=2527964 RepID=A0A517W2Q8_9PLAN|nr:RNA polymerase sigma factor [Gimesia aquarii]QDT99542.1 ECF RNA polymerase sigma factor SigW [Gimesia aquarii]
MKSSRKETQWVLRAQSGDTDALDSLLNAIQEPIYRYIVNLVNNEHLADDILQEVFLLVVRKIYWIKDARAFRPWVYRIASRETFRSLRRERHKPEQPQDPHLLESVEEMSHFVLTDQEIAEALMKLLDQVSPASSAVLNLHYLHEMSLQEVADILEISIGTAKSRLSYGLSTLREKLGPSFRDGQHSTE